MKKPKRLPVSALPDWRFGFFLFIAACARLSFGRDNLPSTVSEKFAEWRIAQNLVANGFFGEGAQADSSVSPLYSTFLAITYKFVEPEWRTYFWINSALDLLTLSLLLIVGRRHRGALAGFGLLFMAVNPVWTYFTIIPNPMGLSLALFAGFLFFWTHPRNTTTHETLAGVALGLLSLTYGLFYLFPVAILSVHLLSAPAKKRQIPIYFIIPAMALPLPWFARNVFAFGVPALGFDPNIPRVFARWATDWMSPYTTLWFPEELGNLFAGIFLPFTSVLGLVGIGFLWKEGKLESLERILLVLIAYLLGVTFLFPIDYRFTLVPYVILSIWSASGLFRLCGVSQR